jgi:UDP-glucose 4-epimerase
MIKSKRALITGGAGYIGHHLQKELKRNGYIVHVLDKNTSKLITRKYCDKVIECDLTYNVEPIRNESYDVCFHLAGFIEVGESETRPYEYYRNNIVSTINLIGALSCKNYVFSSSAGVYDELGKENPKSVYGRTKLMSEKILFDCVREGISCVALRYFNVAGADPDFEFGECHEPETHLIPNILNQDTFILNGNDYDTPDGTCIRDYVHVSDLAVAHIKAAEWLFAGEGATVFNIGSGTGYSIKEVIKTVESVTGKKINVKVGPRRFGDPESLKCDTQLAERMLQFKPKYNLEDIIISAYQWEVVQQRKPKGNQNEE